MAITNFPGGIKAPFVSATGSQVAGVANLTDSSGGTPAATLPAIGGTYSQTEVRNSIASLNAQIAAINAAIKAAGITSA